MVREPRLIFLDEPTSGLDTHKAFLLVRTLTELATSTSSVVVCTIHQPSSDIFALFDDLVGRHRDGVCRQPRVLCQHAARPRPHLATLSCHICPSCFLS